MKIFIFSSIQLPWLLLSWNMIQALETHLHLWTFPYHFGATQVRFLVGSIMKRHYWFDHVIKTYLSFMCHISLDGHIFWCKMKGLLFLQYLDFIHCPTGNILYVETSLSHCHDCADLEWVTTEKEIAERHTAYLRRLGSGWQKFWTDQSGDETFAVSK